MEFFGSINAVYVLLGSMVLGLAGGMLGTFAVLKKQGLLGDALAHASLPGIAVAFLIMQQKFLPGLLLGALISGLMGAFFIYFLVHQTKVKMDSAMASVLSIFFGTGILLLTYIQKLSLASQSGLQSFLFGQAAALLRQDVIMIFGAFLVILLLVIVFWKELKLFIFDPEFARVLGFKRVVLELVFMTIFVTAILMSLQAVGVVLTAALFITPAVTALLWSKKLKIVILLSSFFGMLAGGMGAYTSAIFAKMPTGPLIVIFSSGIFLISLFFAPKRGLINIWLKHSRNSLKIEMENALGFLYRVVEREEEVDLEQCILQGYSRSILKKLRKSGLIVLSEKIVLTQKGLREAKKIIEKHRLWETYLVNRFHLPSDHVHRDAEEMEHILNDEMVGELREILGRPKKDPHGKPIKS